MGPCKSLQGKGQQRRLMSSQVLNGEAAAGIFGKEQSRLEAVGWKPPAL